MNLQLLVIVSLIGAVFYQFSKINKLTQLQKKAFLDSIDLESKVRDENIQQKNLEDEKLYRQKLKERDYKVVYDPLSPGERRLPAHQVPRGLFKDRINIPTRGQPDNYQYLGNLVRDTDDMILPVFGRQEYPGSDYYEYYLMINQDGNFGIKLPLNRGKTIRELEEDQVVNVDYFKSTPGNFVYKPFDYDVPRYNPYDF